MFSPALHDDGWEILTFLMPCIAKIFTAGIFMHIHTFYKLMYTGTGCWVISATATKSQHPQPLFCLCVCLYCCREKLIKFAYDTETNQTVF
jgi:hypothetical protein